jgi:hypothetical protein
MAKSFRGIVSAVLCVAAVAMMAVSSGPAGAKAGDTRIRCDLTGPDINGVPVMGGADFRTRSNPPRIKFLAEACGINLPAGTELDVLVDHHMVGTMMLDNNGRGCFLLDSSVGDLVPRCGGGTQVEVRDGDGNTILSGRF